MDGKNGYLGIVAKAASSFVEGKKEKDLVSRLEGEAVKAMLMSGESTQPKSVGHLLSRVSTWQQDRYNNFDKRYIGYNNNPRGGYNGNTYSPAFPSTPSTNRMYRYDSPGYGGDVEWNTINGNRPLYTRHQGNNDNNTYDGYGNPGRIYNGWNN